MSEAAYLPAAQSDPARFDSLAYRLHPLQVGGIEEGRSAVQIVGQVMQTLYGWLICWIVSYASYDMEHAAPDMGGRCVALTWPSEIDGRPDWPFDHMPAPWPDVWFEQRVISLVLASIHVVDNQGGVC